MTYDMMREENVLWAKRTLNAARRYELELREKEVRLQHLDAQIVRCRCGRPCWQEPCHKVKHCLWCDRPMRQAGWHRSSDKNEVTYGGKGLCMTHYQKVNDAGTEEILEAELDAAVESYWANRDLVRAGLSVDHS